MKASQSGDSPHMAQPASAEQALIQKDIALLQQVTEIYGAKTVAEQLKAAGGDSWSGALLTRWIKGNSLPKPLVEAEIALLQNLLPKPPSFHGNYKFRFIDLFAGIGGIRSGFEAIGGQCVFTSEWNPYSVKTYKANWYNDPQAHIFNTDIRQATLSNMPDVPEEEAYAHLDRQIPQHDVLLAGFPCQPFSLAGVSKKNALGKAHGFECDTQGTLFFDVARIIAVKKPAIFVLENVKNLKSHDKGKTFSIIRQTLDELGYEVADSGAEGRADPKVIDGKPFLPQHRERIVLVGFRRDLNLAPEFTLQDIHRYYPKVRPSLSQLLESQVEDKYILTIKLWEYLYRYAKKHKAKGNGFGFGLVSPEDPQAVTRTLSARYHKDGSEILIDRGWDPDRAEREFHHAGNLARRPRRLTPRECARLMGFEQPGRTDFRIPVSDTQAYRQFGNSVVVPVFAAVAKLLEPYIERAVVKRKAAEAQPVKKSES